MLEALRGADLDLGGEAAALGVDRRADRRREPRGEVGAAADHNDDAAALRIAAAVLDAVELAAPELGSPANLAGVRGAGRSRPGGPTRLGRQAQSRVGS